MLKSSSKAVPGNIRWDDVVDSTLVKPWVLPAGQRLRDQDEATGEISVRVRLFGALASVATKRTLHFVVAMPATVAAVVTALGERLGDAFLARVLDEAGAKQRYCRLFLAGVQIEDLQTPIDGGSVAIDMILLVAIEGG